MSDGIACLLHQIRRRDAAAGGIIAHDVNDLLEQRAFGCIDYDDAARHAVGEGDLVRVSRQRERLHTPVRRRPLG